MIMLFAGAAFLTKMCYLSLAFNTLFTVAFLAIFYWYLRARFNLRVPLVLLGLVFLALQVDALGNFFRMYGRQFGPMQYDEFSHLTVQVLVSPIIIWFVTRLLHAYGYRLPLFLTSFFAATTVFSLSAAYEIIELWDEVHFGGQRTGAMRGRNNILKYKPAPFGDDHARCKRPRPAVCSSATTARPSAAPCDASRATSVFVEGNDS